MTMATEVPEEGGVKGALTRKIGPLPAWGWGVAIGGGYILYRILTGKGFGSGGKSAPALGYGASGGVLPAVPTMPVVVAPPYIKPGGGPVAADPPGAITVPIVQPPHTVIPAPSTTRPNATPVTIVSRPVVVPHQVAPIENLAPVVSRNNPAPSTGRDSLVGAPGMPFIPVSVARRPEPKLIGSPRAIPHQVAPIEVIAKRVIPSGAYRRAGAAGGGF